MSDKATSLDLADLGMRMSFNILIELFDDNA